MHVLVTGGAGYVGSLLVPALLQAGHTVTVLDWFIFEPRQFNSPTPGLTCVVGDLREGEKVKDALARAEAVIHLAAMSNDPSSELDPASTWAINFEASCGLLRAAESAGARRFINASSASVYGVRDEEDVTEELEPRPQTVYAHSKAEFEAYLLTRNRSDFTVTSVRPATLSGYAPRMRLDLTVNILTYHAVCTSEVRIFGGSQYRPNLSVRDMVRAYLTFLELPAEKIGGRTFNLCEANYTVLEIAERIGRVLEREEMPIRRTPTNDNRSYRLCAERAARELGFRAEFDLDHSIREVAAALTDGRIPEPAHPRYRNVEWLKGRKLSGC